MDERNVINPISLSEFPSLNANKKKKKKKRIGIPEFQLRSSASRNVGCTLDDR